MSLEKQLIKLFKHYQENTNSSEEQLEKQFNTLQMEVKDLKIRLGLGKIDQDTYDVTFEHLNDQLQKVSKEMNRGKVKISNLENLLKTVMEKLQNLCIIWGSGDLEEKRALQKIMFPEGIFYDAKNNQYLTREMNQFIELVSCLSNDCEGNKKAESSKISENSAPVAESRLELPTFGL